MPKDCNGDCPNCPKAGNLLSATKRLIEMTTHQVNDQQVCEEDIELVLSAASENAAALSCVLELSLNQVLNVAKIMVLLADVSYRLGVMRGRKAGGLTLVVAPETENAEGKL